MIGNHCFKQEKVNWTATRNLEKIRAEDFQIRVVYIYIYIYVENDCRPIRAIKKNLKVAQLGRLFF